MSRRANGEGSIVQRKDGLWQASIQINGKRRTVYGKTEREARKKLREIQRQIDTVGALPNPGNRTLTELVEAWLETATLKPSTVAQYRKFYGYVKPALGHVKLSNISPDAIQKLYAEFTPSVATHIHRLLHRAFAVAVMWRWLPANPTDSVIKPSHKPTRKTLWTPKELGVFLDGTPDHWLRPLWVFLVGTGCRIGEALALQWDNIDTDNAVTIDGTLHWIGGQCSVSKPKTPSGTRVILLPVPVIDALKTIERKSEFVFTNQSGQPLHPSTVQHAMKRECERLELPPMTPHGLRHMHASLLIGEGLPITAVSARLGHSAPDITLRTYAHTIAGQDAQATQAIDRVLGNREGEG